MAFSALILDANPDVILLLSQTKYKRLQDYTHFLTVTKVKTLMLNTVGLQKKKKKIMKSKAICTFFYGGGGKGGEH